MAKTCTYFAGTSGSSYSSYSIEKPWNLDLPSYSYLIMITKDKDTLINYDTTNLGVPLTDPT